MNESSHPAAASPRSILIVLMGALGDVVRGLSLVAPLKERYPECTITWLVEPRCEGIVRLHPGIDRVLVFDRGGRNSLLRIRRDLRMVKPDLTLDLQRHFKSGLFSWLSGAPRRIGFHRRNAKELNWIFNNEQIAECPDDLAKIRHYWKFLEHLGMAAPDTPRFGFEELEAAALCGEHQSVLTRPFVALVMGSSWHSKDWIAGGYLHLTRAILAEGRYGVVLLGDRTQQELAGKISREAGTGVVDLAGKTTLPQLVGILKLARACVGPDSGPGHIAGALGRPYVALFGPTSPARVAPYGSEHLAIQSAIGCAPCYRRHCPGLDKLCMRLIGVEAVMAKLAEALPGPHLSRR